MDDIFKKIDEVCLENSKKVLKAFWKENLSESDFNSTTGYGYGDVGRDKIERIYSDIFKSEASLVRNQFISGTHALTVAFLVLMQYRHVYLHYLDLGIHYYLLQVNHMIHLIA